MGPHYTFNPIRPLTKQLQQLKGASGNYNMCTPFTLRFAFFLFDPIGPFIFIFNFWPILASTASSKIGPFSSFEAILVSYSQ